MSKEINAIEMLNENQKLIISQSAPTSASYLRVDRGFFIDRPTISAGWYDCDDEELYESPSKTVYDQISHLIEFGNFWSAIYVDQLLNEIKHK